MGQSRLVEMATFVGLASHGSLACDERDAMTVYRSAQWRADSAVLLCDYFMRLAERMRPATLLELGAHRADASTAFRRRVGNRAIAFEANPFTFASLTKEAERAGVEVRNLGVGAVAGVADLHIPLFGEAPSLTPGQASLRRRTEDIDYETVRIEVTTLDAIAQDLNVDGGVALWVDVEGMGLDVLSSGRGLLNRSECRFAMVEVETRAFWDGQSSAEEVDQLMASADFVPVMCDAEYPFQHNVIYVKDADAPGIGDLIAGYWGDLAGIQFRDPRSWTGRLLSGANVKARLRRLVGSRAT